MFFQSHSHILPNKKNTVHCQHLHLFHTEPFVVHDLEILMNKPDLLMDRAWLVYIWELRFVFTGFVILLD